jgi:superfamily II DNA or RNA helicase
MARLEAISTALYFPTPDRVVDLIAQKFDVIANGGRLLDPCAGTGAAARLASAWGLEPYGVELDAERAVSCATVMETLLGSYHQLASQDGSFSVLFLNPPYDTVDSQLGASVRQEREFLRDCTPFLATGGLLVYVVPDRVVTDQKSGKLLRDDYEDIQVFQFPEPEHEAFKQVVLFARKRTTRGFSSYYTVAITGPFTTLGAPSEKRPLELPRLSRDFEFKLRGSNPVEQSPGTTGGCFRSARWKSLVTSDPSVLTRPLLAPRPGHVAMLLAAGALDGTEISGNRLVKGSSEKTTTECRDEEAGVVSIREKMVSRLSVLDLSTGELTRWRADEEPEKTKTWFDEHGPALAAAVRRDHVPLYDGSLEGVDFSGVRAPGILHGYTEPTLLEAQKVAAVAITRCWTLRRSVILSGELGCGKTSCAVVASVLAGHEKTIVVVPTHLTKKWVREANAITGMRNAARIAKCLADVDAFFADETTCFLILSKEKAKLGARWEAAVSSKVMKVTRVVYEDSEDVWGRRVPVEREEVAYEKVPACPKCGASVRGEEGNLATESWLGKNKRTCGRCEEQLWESRPISTKGTTRWPLAKYINQYYPGRFHLVLDEAHFIAHSETDQSRAVQLLCSCAIKILAMTGTLYGGRASSIYHLLYKLDPTFRDAYGYKDTPRFVENHGLLETIYPLEEYTSRFGYRRNNSGGRVKEVPGVDPAMLNLLLSYTVWLRISDLGHKLPEFSEQVEVVDHDPDVLATCQALVRDTKLVLREHPRVLGQYLMAGLGYPDCPERAESIVDKGDYNWSTPEEVASAPAFETQTWPKDARLLEIALAKKAVDRKVLVFFTQTDKRSPIPRVKTILEAGGLKVTVLDTGVTPEKREEWLQERSAQFDVLLTNGKLVETGLDLLWATTIVQYGVEYCVTPETRILTESLLWKPAGDLVEGERLIGFDENPVSASFRRRLRPCHVVSTRPIQAEVYRLELSDGTVVRASAEHPWLVMKNPNHPIAKWCKTEDLAKGPYRKSGGFWLPRFFHPWDVATDFEAGYVAGMFDGEGHLTFKHPSRNGGVTAESHGTGGMRLGYAQLPGACLDAVTSTLDREKVPFRCYPQKPSGVMNLVVSKGVAESLRCLGIFRPRRLLNSFINGFQEGRVDQKFKVKTLLKIERVVSEGIQTVIGMETSTHTYFAEGFGAHNSINTLRQSTHRSWRLGQTEEVDVVYMVYRDTMQELAMSLISRKMRAAELMDGDGLGGLSQHDAQGSDFLIELARMAVQRQDKVEEGVT